MSKAVQETKLTCLTGDEDDMILEALHHDCVEYDEIFVLLQRWFV